jgi:hypothetical protein
MSLIQKQDPKPRRRWGWWTVVAILVYGLIRGQIVNGILLEQNDTALFTAMGDGILIGVAIIAWFGFGNTWQAMVLLFKNGIGSVTIALLRFILMSGIAIVSTMATGRGLSANHIVTTMSGAALTACLLVIILLAAIAVAFIFALLPWHRRRQIAQS